MSLKLTLSKRPGQIGPSINTRTEKHGEEDVPGIDIPVSGIYLNAEELAIVLEDQDAQECFYVGPTGKAAAEPRFMRARPLQLEGKLTDAKVQISVGDHQVLLKPAKIKGISLEFRVGGLTEMSCIVQGNPSANTDVLELLNARCKISISGAERQADRSAEPELDLEHHSGAEEPQVNSPEDLGYGGKPRRAAKKQ